MSEEERLVRYAMASELAWDLCLDVEQEKQAKCRQILTKLFSTGDRKHLEELKREGEIYERVREAALDMLRE